MAGKATAIFDGDDSRLSAAINRIDKKLLDLQGRFGKVFGFAKAVLGAAIIAKGASELAEGFRGALDAGGRMNDVSANTGIAVDEVMLLEQAFKDAGKSAEDVPAVINKMQRALAEGKADDLIQKLGFNLADLKKKTPAEQFETLGAAINQIEDPAQRSAAAMAIFGKSGASLLSLFASGGFRSAADAVGSQAEILNRDAALFDAVGDKLGHAGIKLQGFFVGVADRVVPLLNPLLDRFEKMDLAGMGQQVGDVVAFLVQTFSDGSLWDIVATSGKIALAKVGNFLAGMIAAIGRALWQYVVESFKNGVAVLQIVTSADFWKGIAWSLLSAASAFNALMLNGIADYLDLLAKVPGLGKLASAGATAARGQGAQRGMNSAVFASVAADSFTPAVEKVTSRMGETFRGIEDSIVAGFNAGSTLFDTAGAEADLAAQIDRALQGVAGTTAAQLAANPVRAAGGAGDEDLFSKDKAGISSLQKIGLGGFGGGDQMLDESKRHTSILTEIKKDTALFLKAFKPGATTTVFA